MRYIDLGVQPLPSLEKRKRKRKKIILLAGSAVAAVIVGIFVYAFYWPLSAIVSEILKNPGTVLSYFKERGGKLESTNGRTNFLILGIDKRANVPYTYLGPSGKQVKNGFLSDTIIIASFDLITKKTSLISIPRDTWVSIPGWNDFPETEGKINSVYSLGDTYNYPGGGLKLAEKVITSHLGIPIHYGVRVDFEGFKKSVGTLDGIDVTVEKSFDDFAYPVDGKETGDCLGGGFNCRYEHIHFDEGLQHMDGATALKFARSRTGTNGEGSDFARARRQQKVIQAFLKKAIAVKNLLDPVKTHKLFNNLGNSIETDFDLASLPSLLKLAKNAKLDKFKTLVLEPASGLMYHPSEDTYGGAYVIVPKNGWGEIKLKVREFLTPKVTKKK